MKHLTFFAVLFLSISCQKQNQPIKQAPLPLKAQFFKDARQFRRQNLQSATTFAPDWSATLKQGGVATLHAKHQHAPITVRLKSWGRANKLSPLRTTATPHINGTQLHYKHDRDLTEWYHHKPKGLEHGFTIGRAPAGQGHLTMAMHIGGGTLRRISPTALAVDTPSGATMRYDGLKVWDANHQPLPSHMVVATKNTAHLVVDDRQATYPITIDPTWSMEQKLPRPNFVENDRFGISFDINGNQAIIGAPGVTGPMSQTNAGAAYIYERSNQGRWELKTTLIAQLQNGPPFLEPETNEAFGTSVSIEGNYAVIGAPGRAYPDAGCNQNCGVAYLFKRLDDTTWYIADIIEQGEGLSAEGRFGQTVKLRNQRIVLGAPGQSQAFAYIVNTSFDTADKISTDLSEANSNLGTSIAMDSDSLLIGAPRTNKVLYYKWNSAQAVWQFQNRLSPPAASNGFGHALAVNGTTLVVGANQDSVQGNQAGAAFTFERSGTLWQYKQTLTAPTPTAGEQFGSAVALTTDLLLIGAPWGNQAPQKGSAYMFSKTNEMWSYEDTIQSSTSNATDGFGTQVALLNQQALVTAPKHASTNPTSTGDWFEYTPVAKPADEAPTFTAPTMDTTINVEVMSNWSYTLTATDNNDSTLQFSAQGTPQGMTTQKSGDLEFTLNWTPAPTDLNTTIPIVITATDSAQNTTNITITLTVVPKDTIPNQDITITQPTKDQVLENTLVTIEGAGKPNETVNITITPQCGMPIQTNNNTNEQGTLKFNQALPTGDYTLSVQRPDATEPGDSATVTFKVRQRGTEQPILEGIPSNEDCSYTITSGDPVLMIGAGPPNTIVQIDFDDASVPAPDVLSTDNMGRWIHPLPTNLKPGTLKATIQLRFPDTNNVTYEMDIKIIKYPTPAFERDNCSNQIPTSPTPVPLLWAALLVAAGFVRRKP